MVKKQLIRKSEKRVLIYLNQVHITKCYITMIAAKLDIDYSYLIKTLNSMQHKAWVKKNKGLATYKSFYKLTELGFKMLSLAKQEVKE